MEDSISKIAERYGVITHQPMIGLGEAKSLGEPIEWDHGGSKIVAC